MARDNIERGVTETTNDEPLLPKWMVDIEARANNTNMLSEATIYKVPAFLREVNPKAFTPLCVSFGPFHHDNPGLKAMENYKDNAFVRFITRANKPRHNIVHEVAKIITNLRDMYFLLDQRWRTDDEEFLKVMIVDGCFMLEVLLFCGRYYPVGDPFFSIQGVYDKYMVHIRRDMLLIENQLPLFLLSALFPFQIYDYQDNQSIDSFINELVLKFVANGNDTTENTTFGLHALDLYRQSLLSPELEQPNQSEQPVITAESFTASAVIRCAVELHEAGVSFEKSKTKSLNDVHFNSKTGKLHLPFLMVEDGTECSILNIMAFEHLHVNVDRVVTSYIWIMTDVIDSSKDVSLLLDKGIMSNLLGSDAAVAHLFNSIAKEFTLVPSISLLRHLRVRQEVYKYCSKKTNRWRANLIHTYFRSPWSAISLAGALLVIGLTIIQTVYAILK